MANTRRPVRGSSSMLWTLALVVLVQHITLTTASELTEQHQHNATGGGGGDNVSSCDFPSSSDAAALTPVCGTDEKTYSSLRALHCANNGTSKDNQVQVAYNGKCEDPCWQAINPASAGSITLEKQIAMTAGAVCGSDGIMYPSEVVLTCVQQQIDQGNLSVVDVEKCTSEKPTKKFDPCMLAYVAARKICGSDNVTYNNVWHMRCTAEMYQVADLSTQHEGECNIQCPYSPIYNPVCSSSEYMFANIEALKCRQILAPYIKNDLHHHGHCARHLNQNPCYVDNAYNPVCATNGRTYTSPRHVLCLKDVNPALSVVHSGPCSVDEVKATLGTTRACALATDLYEWNPVCGSDNVTYGNPFRFVCAALNKTTDLQVAYTGECGGFDYCRVIKEGPTPSKEAEVCGNDGVTYASLQALYCAQNSKKHLHLSHTGACKETDDPCLFRGTPFLDNNGTPVCTSNGVSYVSPQAAWCAAKTDPGIEFKHDGECF